MANNAPTDNSSSALTAAFEDHLAKSGLTPADVPHWQFIENLFDVHGDKRYRGVQAIEIPYYCFAADGLGERIVDNGEQFARWRILSGNPRQRYVTRPGSQSHPFVPPNFAESLQESTGVLVITEGEKKAVAACGAGVPTIALPGVSTGLLPQESGAARDADTPVLPDLLELIEQLKDAGLTTVIVMFDANGAEISRREYNKLHKDGKDEFAAVGHGKKKVYVKNPQVRREAILLANAIRKQAEIATAADFVPVSIQTQRVTGANNREYDKVLPSFPGIDDFLLAAGDQARFAFEDLVSDAVQSAEKPADEDDQEGGFIPLGFRGDSNIDYPVWSKIRERVHWIKQNDLSKAQVFEAAGGFDWCHNAWPMQSDDGEGAKSSVTPLDIAAARRFLLNAAERAGEFDPKRIKPFGVRKDAADATALVVHSVDGVFRIAGDDCQRIERCVDGRNEIYPLTSPEISNHFGFPEEAGTPDDVRKYVNDIVEGWHWSSDFQARLFAGWGLLQVYCAALDTRPLLFLSAASGTGKTHLLRYLRDTFSQWTLFFADAGDVSPAGLRHLLIESPLGCLMDESEEEEQREDARNSSEVRKRNLRAHRQLFRAAFSADELSVGAVRGTVEQKAIVQEIHTMALYAAVNEPALAETEKTRTLRLKLDKLTEDQTNAKPPVADRDQGDRITRRMFQCWKEFCRLVTAIRSKILPKADARVRDVHAFVIGAYAAGLGLSEESPEIADLVAQAEEHHAEQQMVEPSDESQNAVDALRSASIIVTDTAGQKVEMKVVEAVREAAARGLGEAGRGGGGAEGRALAMLGMTAKRGDRPNLLWLFVAHNDPAFRTKIEPQTGYAPVLMNVLSRVPGVVKPATRDGRVKIAGTKKSGIWLPLEIEPDDDDQYAPPPAPEVNAASVFADI